MSKKYFKVISTTITRGLKDISKEVTKHSLDRTSRLSHIREGQKPLYSFVVDTDHPNGLEVHTITEDATIYIQNLNTSRLITVLYARVGQIDRYFKDLNVDYSLIREQAYLNNLQGRNNL